ncbi:MAG: AtpZ/AtpI family protein [Sulfurifustis sp.]
MIKTLLLPATATRVPHSTNAEVNTLIRTRADARVALLEGGRRVEFEARLAELAREWDIERVLQANAAALVIIGTLLGYRFDRRFLLLPFAVLGFFAQHALFGWCPPVPLFRRRGVRTVREIERERYAVKALRGDFDSVVLPRTASAERRVRAALAAVDA